MTPTGRYDGAAALVTGAQGFIGSWLAARLLAEGAEVLVPRRDARADSHFQVAGIEERCTLVDVDILDLGALRGLIDAHSVATVFHLAAQSTVAVANRDPFTTFDVNVRGTYALLEACRTAARPVEEIVVASSYLAYGISSDGPPGPETELRGTYPYEVSKACADVIARSYAHAYGLPVAVLRLANVYGGGDFNFTRLVPETARALARGERPVLRSDGTPERDFLYIEDAVEAYLAVAGSLSDPAAHGRAWNAGVGRTVPVIEVVRALVRAAGSGAEPQVEASPTTPGELDRHDIDASAIRTELGWRPRWTLERGLAETYSWYERQLTASP